MYFHLNRAQQQATLFIQLGISYLIYVSILTPYLPMFESIYVLYASELKQNYYLNWYEYVSIRDTHDLVYHYINQLASQPASQLNSVPLLSIHVLHTPGTAT
ncbi:hypothetical protein T310_0544 [Rasamsonia emersonii CBS 393.64]|uniref:Uncharacterized protein n=1 Tax=Rasamsonia emersonii (strain ATCC 16479 / CBS 393.64 / IMI 116815) TaxID=1408163 RepID=A0A0F4Z6E4_RASE3|nr:hypothetical protein T310_0544 [Rasamsonia emersonii CBS 393.64]KKA25443.1 hypothetical protein T310_0544 [Rasamsonia emersonii CBS 393.64]